MSHERGQLGASGEALNEELDRIVLWNSSSVSEFLSLSGGAINSRAQEWLRICQGTIVQERSNPSLGSDIEQSIKTLYKAFYEAWHLCRDDYDDRRINSEHTLQAALYFHLRSSLDPSHFVVLTELAGVLPPDQYGAKQEAGKTRQKKRDVLDLIVAKRAVDSCGERLEILMAIELKYLPRGFPKDKDIKKDLSNLSRVWKFKDMEKRTRLGVERFNGSATSISINNNRVLVWGVFCDDEKCVKYLDSEFWTEPRIPDRWSSIKNRRRPPKLVVAYCRTKDSRDCKKEKSSVVIEGPLHSKYVGVNTR